MRTTVERFWAKVEERGEGCWRWTAATRCGYGRFWLPSKKLIDAHRYAYELEVGPIPPGLDLDHLCRNRWCVNPAHLEPVTRRENLMRGNTLTAAHHAGRDCGSPSCKNCRRFHKEEVA